MTQAAIGTSTPCWLCRTRLLHPPATNTSPQRYCSALEGGKGTHTMGCRWQGAQTATQIILILHLGCSSGKPIKESPRDTFSLASRPWTASSTAQTRSWGGPQGFEVLKPFKNISFYGFNLYDLSFSSEVFFPRFQTKIPNQVFWVFCHLLYTNWLIAIIRCCVKH